jgi:hypothetical protein
LGQAALALAKGGDEQATPAQVASLLALAEKALAASREVLAMRGQYFTDIVQYGVEAARQMAFLVEQSHDAVHSASHKTVRESLNQRLESEAAKMLARAHLDRVGGAGGASHTGSGSSAGGAAAED